MTQLDLAGKKVIVNKTVNCKNEKESFPNSEISIQKELVKYSRSIWNFKDPPRTDKEKKHGATFSLKMAKRILWIYSEENDLVYDPFLGTGTTLNASIELNRNFIGSELNPEFFNENIEPILKQKRLTDTYSFEAKLGDCRNCLEYINEDSVRLIFTSPPYANNIQRTLKDRESRSIVKIKNSEIKQYSESELDFGNLGYTDFLIQFEELLKKWFKIVKTEGFVIILIKDFRDVDNNKPYICFHSDLANLGVKCGFLWHDLIIIDQNDFRKSILNGSKAKFYVNLNNSFLVILRKAKKI